METLANLECFIRSAAHGSFSEAARRLSVTPAAVSRSVAMLERNLGIRLFHRSTRKLTLTEAGEAFRLAIADNLDGIQAAIAGASSSNATPTGTLKVSMAPTFGTMHVLPLLPGFLKSYPRVRPEWHFENRAVDLVADGYDAAIGGGFELTPGIVSRVLAPAHIIPVASPAYMDGRVLPSEPLDLEVLDGIVMRPSQSGRLRQWMLRNTAGDEIAAALTPSLIVNDPGAMREAALLGLGVAMVALPDVLPALEAGRLVRLLPRWYADAGTISIYYSSSKLLPPKTRVFVDWTIGSFRRQRLAKRFAATSL